jgi:hypothetical protein
MLRVRSACSHPTRSIWTGKATAWAARTDNTRHHYRAGRSSFTSSIGASLASRCQRRARGHLAMKS